MNGIDSSNKVESGARGVGAGAGAGRMNRDGRRGLVERGALGGQAAVIVALAMLFIILMVGLAIDGGASYGLRRQAQNASDGSALAGGRKMLDYYEQMVLANPDYDVDGTSDEELAIR